MLSKKKRVTKKLFLSVMKDSDVLFGSFFVFRYTGSDLPKYAVVAPKSLAKSAATRIKLRRKAYPVIRSIDPKSGTGIFFYKKNGLNATHEDIKADIINLMKKAKLI